NWRRPAPESGGRTPSFGPRFFGQFTVHHIQVSSRDGIVARPFQSERTFEPVLGADIVPDLPPMPSLQSQQGIVVGIQMIGALEIRPGSRGVSQPVQAHAYSRQAPSIVRVQYSGAVQPRYRAARQRRVIVVPDRPVAPE